MTARTMIFNADLHIHGMFSGATSKNMRPKSIAAEARKKGVDVVGTGDCLHQGWLAEFDGATKIDDGTIEISGTRFVYTAEVEDKNRVHHLLIFPDLGAVEEFRHRVIKHSKNINSDGRPNLNMGGARIAEIALDVDALIGPCHAFTPWTSLYAYFSSLRACYGDLADHIHFLELGLSADTNYADRIAELRNITFLTNSDAHSPHPVRLAREFNRIEADDASFEGLRSAILRRAGRVVLNVGLPPQEGKYNESACIRCFRHYVLGEAIAMQWRCICGGKIKKGVKDRVEELATYTSPRHPEHRPAYLHIIPLAEIISKALGKSSPFNREVIALWNRLVKAFGTEISVLVDADIRDVAKISNEVIASAIMCFRAGRISIIPGGGGKYGVVILPGSKAVAAHACSGQDDEKKREKLGQRTLLDFGGTQ